MSSPARKNIGGVNNSGNSGRSDFASALKKWSAPIPPVLLRRLGRASESPLGKVKVMLRVCGNSEEVTGNGTLGVDQRRKQVTLIDPGGANTLTPEERRVSVSAPKIFAFDGIFAEDDDQAEISASAAELVASVVGGEDGCFVSLGNTGKRQTMFGKPASQKMGSVHFGVVPTAISWLFKSIQEQKQKISTRFSVRVSALEVVGGSGHEVINDLLLPFVNDGDQQQPQQSGTTYLLDSNGGKNCNTSSTTAASGAAVLSSVSEIRAPTPESAGYYLDAMLEGIQREDPSRHIVFTLHVYRYSIDKNGKGVIGGRSRLHCVMLGNGCPSISVLGGLLLAVLNGQRHLPSRDSKLGAILRECIGSITCRAVVMIHVSNAHSRYAETLAALQLGSRVHRLRRSRRLKMGSVSSGNGSGGSSGSGEEMRNALIVSGSLGTVGIAEGDPSSDSIDPSSSEQSCDTVIYLGPSLDDATDGEGVPHYLSSLEAGVGENGIIPSKCPLGTNSQTGLQSKTKSPKPKSSGSGGKGESSKSEYGWIDGPKVAKYRQLPTSSGSSTSTTTNSSSNSSSTTVGPSPSSVSKKNFETWIDGPAARIHHHQGNNFPSPKKSLSLSQRQTRGGNSSSAGVIDMNISSEKAQMIQKWISNQNPHSFALNSSTTTHPSEKQHEEIEPLYNTKNNGTNNLMYSSNCHQQPYSMFCNDVYNNGGQREQQTEYKSMTVFKTCEDEMMTLEDTNGYEFELIEVVEPEVLVPMKDACLQVTEEDIALSFLEENPLPESDQNFDFYLPVGDRGRSYSFSEGPLSQCQSEKCDDHPLRVLSQECLTVVSTFADGADDLERFWPRLSFTNSDITMRDIHEIGMCQGLCKNLVGSHSQMSLPTNGVNCGNNFSNNTNNVYINNQQHHYIDNDIYMKSPLPVHSNNGLTSKAETKILLKTLPPLRDPPILSDETIFQFKIPSTPIMKMRNSKLAKGANKPTSGNKDTSESEMESITIPPMKLLDLAPISRPTSSLSPTIVTTNNISPIRGCDHNHTNNSNATNNHLYNGNNILLNGNNTSPTTTSTTSNLSSSPSITNSPSSGLVTNNIFSQTPTSPISPAVVEVVTKSPSKSKSRKIAKFFRSRSKSPKTAGATSTSSESGKSSVSSADTSKSSSSASSCSSGFNSKLTPCIPNSNNKHQSPKHHVNQSPKHQSPSKKSMGKNQFSTPTDYHFHCDSVLPAFLPKPTTTLERQQQDQNGISDLKATT